VDNINTISERIESLFTRIPIDKLGELSEQALKEVQSGFHFAQAQFWIFFLLVYIGFAAVMGNRISRWLNITFVAIIGWFAIATPVEDPLGVGMGWVYWIALSVTAFIAIINQNKIQSWAQRFSAQLKEKKIGNLFNILLFGSAISAILIPSLEFSISYYLVLIISYIVFSVVYDRTRMRSAYLMLVSLFFYWKVGAPFVWILLFSTVIDFYLGKAVYLAKTNGRKKLFLAISVIVNLSVLVYFKYFNFFATEWNTLDLPSWMHIAHAKENAIGIWLNGGFNANIFLESLPMVVGISYYTFQTMSYSIDIYRGHIKPLKNIIDFGFFVSFFPQLVAGPIVRASEFVPQIHKEFSLSKSEFGWALYMILKGLIKKMVFADFIAVYFLDQVFASPDEFSGAANLVAIFGYSLQIYGDFAGYTDMAIGVARLFGFKLPTNFNAPYKAIHCGEFWKRWHITLSNWLKDYLYIPLGGNRGGTSASYIVAGLIISGVLYAVGSWQTTVIVLGVIATIVAFSWYSAKFFNHINRNINVTLTMLLGGLWHGASWQFVIWGGLNGVGVLSSKYWSKFKPFYKVAVALVIAGVLYFIKESTSNDIWILGVYWALIAGGMALIHGLLQLAIKQATGVDPKYLTFLWIRIVSLVLLGYGWTASSSILLIIGGIGGVASLMLTFIKVKPLAATFLYYSKRTWGVFHTLFFITFTRIYFRGESMEKISAFYHQLLNDFGDLSAKLFITSAEGNMVINPDWLFSSSKVTGFLDYNVNVFIIIILGYLIHWVPSFMKKKIENGFSNSPMPIQLITGIIIVVLCYQAYSSDAAAFIYYQF